MRKKQKPKRLTAKDILEIIGTILGILAAIKSLLDK